MFLFDEAAKRRPASPCRQIYKFAESLFVRLHLFHWYFNWIQPGNEIRTFGEHSAARVIHHHARQPLPVSESFDDVAQLVARAVVERRFD